MARPMLRPAPVTSATFPSSGLCMACSPAIRQVVPLRRRHEGPDSVAHSSDLGHAGRLGDGSLAGALATRDRRIGWLCALSVLLIWVAFQIVGRASTHQALTPWDVTALRHIGAFIAVLPIAVAARHPAPAAVARSGHRRHLGLRLSHRRLCRLQPRPGGAWRRHPVRRAAHRHRAASAGRCSTNGRRRRASHRCPSSAPASR